MFQVPFSGAGPDAVEERGSCGQPEAGRGGRGRGGLSVGEPRLHSLGRLRLSLRLTESES